MAVHEALGDNGVITFADVLAGAIEESGLFIKGSYIIPLNDRAKIILAIRHRVK